MEQLQQQENKEIIKNELINSDSIDPKNVKENDPSKEKQEVIIGTKKSLKELSKAIKEEDKETLSKEKGEVTNEEKNTYIKRLNEFGSLAAHDFKATLDTEGNIIIKQQKDWKIGIRKNEGGIDDNFIKEETQKRLADWIGGQIGSVTHGDYNKELIKDIVGKKTEEWKGEKGEEFVWYKVESFKLDVNDFKKYFDKGNK